MTSRAELDELGDIVRELYRVHAAAVPYHGWHHVNFVVQKVSNFLVDLHADRIVTIAAAYVHDFNYLVAGDSVESAGREMRAEVLAQAGFSASAIARIESIVMESSTSQRHAVISREAMALSDADTAYKALPIAPLMTIHYMSETGCTIRELAQKIVSEQAPLDKKGIYFYSTRARSEYGEWADANLRLWERVLDSMDTTDVSVVLDAMK